jgi:hypothetical protein
MRGIYSFFEIVFYKLNSIRLIGQSEENNAHFAALFLSLLFDFNIIAFMILLDKLKLVSFWLTNEYKIITLLGSTYLIVYLMFIRKDKYKAIRTKYSNKFIVQKSRMTYYISSYLIFTFMLFVLILLV